MVYINDDIFGFDLGAALAALPQWRRERALKYKWERDRRLSAAAYMLLRRGLREEFGIEGDPAWEWGEGGKPRLRDFPEVNFSISHCREAALCAVDREPIGADIESVGRYKPSLARYVLSDEELALVERSPSPERAFTRLWTMKESYLKLTGEGLATDLKPLLARAEAQFFTAEPSRARYIYTICKRGDR